MAYHTGEQERFAQVAKLLNNLEDALDMTINWSKYPEALLGAQWAVLFNEATRQWDLFPIPEEDD